MGLLSYNPANFNVSLAFIVLLVAALSVYMGIRCVRRVSFVTVGFFLIQMCMLASGVLAVTNRVMTIPLYELMLIVPGVIVPAVFLITDYLKMKKRIKIANADVPLIEKLEKPSTREWSYEDYIEVSEEWKSEVPAADVVKHLAVEDKNLKTNITRQLTKVHELIEGKEYKRALDNYIILSEILSGNPFIAYNTGWLYYKNKLYDDAAEYYREALTLIGERPDGKGKKVKNEEAVSFLRPMIYFGYGLCLYAKNMYEMAANQFALAQNCMGELWESEINIARCHIAVGELDKAQEHINTALKTRDDNKLRFILAKICYEKNQEMECKFHLETIVSKDPEFTEAWVLLGELYRKCEDWNSAQNAYKNLIRLVPDNAEYYYLLGIVQRELGKTEEALSSLKYATGLMPGHSRALYSMASIYDAQGKTENAIECLFNSLNGNEKLEMAYNLLAEIYIANDRINEAIHVYEKAARLHTHSYIVHYNLGITLMMMRRYDEAIDAFKKAHKITSDDPPLYYNWASAAIGLKNYSEAARLFKEGLKFRPDDDEILYGLARVSALSGDVDATMAFLKQAIEINPNLKLRAKSSHDFAAYRTYPEFMEITRLPLREDRKNA